MFTPYTHNIIFIAVVYYDVPLLFTAFAAKPMIISDLISMSICISRQFKMIYCIVACPSKFNIINNKTNKNI